MQRDTRTDAEKHADLWAQIVDALLDATMGAEPAERADEPLTEDEETILNWIIEHSRKQ